MLEDHPILCRIALVALLTAGLGIGGYALTGQAVFVAESHADVPDPATTPKPLRTEKTDRLAVASVLGTAQLVSVEEAPARFEAVKRDFAKAFDSKTSVAERDIRDRAGKRVDLMSTIIRAAAATDVDPVYLIAVADKESDLRPNLDSSRSSAQGLFQFLDGTWLELVREYGPRHKLKAEAASIRMVDGQPVVADEAMRKRILALRDDPYISAVMAGEMAKRDRDLLARTTGRDPTVAEAYMAHFLGRGGAQKFVQAFKKSPHQSAPALFPEAAQANPTIFYVRIGDDRKDLTVAQVYDRIERSIDRRVARFTGVGNGVAKANAAYRPPAETSRSIVAGSTGGGIGGSALSFAP